MHFYKKLNQTHPYSFSNLLIEIKISTSSDTFLLNDSAKHVMWIYSSSINVLSIGFLVSFLLFISSKSNTKILSFCLPLHHLNHPRTSFCCLLIYPYHKLLSFTLSTILHFTWMELHILLEAAILNLKITFNHMLCFYFLNMDPTVSLKPYISC